MKDTVKKELLNVPVALRHCPKCGVIVAFRYGVMQGHPLDGRGGVCPSHAAGK